MATKTKGLSKKSFSLRTFKDDAIAGFVNAVVSVPDGLATAALAGVNPVAGLYASATGPLAGGFLQSSHLMAIATTSASGIAAGQAVAAYPEDQRPEAMFTLVVITGVLLLMFGLLRVGHLVRYVPYSVMQGFLFGVSAVLFLDQLAPMVGYSPEGPNEVAQFIDLLANIGSWNLSAVVLGVLALGLVLLANRTRFSTWSTLVGLAVPTLLLVLVGWQSVEQVVDVSPIPAGLPALSLPDLGLISLELVLAAAALAAVIAIQGAGVSQSIDNPDGSKVNVSTDMSAQGMGNIVSGLFSGIPVGGSVGQTALVVSAGAKSRWNEIFCGIWMLVIILLLGPVIEVVPMAALGALMVVAAIASINLRDVVSIMRTNLTAAAGFAVTLLASLLFSVPVAVFTGVALAIVMNLVRSSRSVTVRELNRNEADQLVESDAPEVLPAGQVTVLNVYGDLFFSGAQTLNDRLPSTDGVERAVVVLRMRDVENIGATLIDLLDDYSEDLHAGGGRLYLSGIRDVVAEQLRRSGKLDLTDEVIITPATDILGESTRQARAEAQAWLDSGLPAPRKARRVRVPGRAVLPEGALQPPKEYRD